MGRSKMVRVALAGLDGAGKTTTLQGIKGLVDDKSRKFGDPVPASAVHLPLTTQTPGYDQVEFKYRDTKLMVWDFGGHVSTWRLVEDKLRADGADVVAFFVDPDKPKRFPEASKRLRELGGLPALASARILVVGVTHNALCLDKDGPYNFSRNRPWLQGDPTDEAVFDCPEDEKLFFDGMADSSCAGSMKKGRWRRVAAARAARDARRAAAERHYNLRAHLLSAESLQPSPKANRRETRARDARPERTRAADSMCKSLEIAVLPQTVKDVLMINATTPVKTLVQALVSTGQQRILHVRTGGPGGKIYLGLDEAMDTMSVSSYSSISSRSVTARPGREQLAAAFSEDVDDEGEFDEDLDEDLDEDEDHFKMEAARLEMERRKRSPAPVRIRGSIIPAR
eukprot:m.138497 g.138497  ORF g.138497 m.138497 type:complete len:397 (-) comp17032_c0_seq2:31-1221(-)